MGSPVQLNEKKMDYLTQAGLWRVRLGLESGSERTKKEVYNRHMPNEAIQQAARIINKYPQIVLCYFLIIANPYEEREDLLATARFLADLPRSYFLQVYNLVFFPGTLLFDRAVEDGLVDGKINSGYDLNYRGGLRYQTHSWKRKNLYLNSLIFLMEGKSTRFRLGMLPRFFLPLLLSAPIVNFHDRFSFFTEFLIQIKLFTLHLRSYVARFIQRLLKNPNSVYNLRGYLKQKIKNALIVRF